MPKPGQKSVTLNEQTYNKAKILAENDKTPQYPEGKPVATKIAELIEEKTEEA